MKLRLILPPLAVLLAGCAASAPQYYSLQTPLMASGGQEYQVVSDYVISVQPVLVPEQVARPQIVVADQSGAEVIPLNAALWVGPLESQIRAALSDSLTRRLKVLDIGQSKAVDLPVWRIYVDVQRFDSLYGEAVRQDIVWRMVPQGVPEASGKRVCSAQLQLPVGDGMSALVEGHRRALDTLTGLMARTLPAKGDSATAIALNVQEDGLHFRGCVD